MRPLQADRSVLGRELDPARGVQRSAQAHGQGRALMSSSGASTAVLARSGLQTFAYALRLAPAWSPLFWAVLFRKADLP